MEQTSGNPYLDFIFRRRSIRQFTGELVEREAILWLLQAGMAAPSACCKDPWHFLVVDNRQQCESIAQFLPNGKFLPDAGLGIVVCGDQTEAHGGLEGYLIQDCSAAIENILLAATALGLGACWLGVYPREDRVQGLKKLFRLPESVIPIGVIAVGKTKITPPPRTRYNDAKVHWNQW